MKITFPVVLLLFLFSCTAEPSAESIGEAGEIFVLGNSWFIDPDIPSRALFSSLMNERFRSNEKDLRITHLGVYGETPAQVLDRLSALRQKETGLLILEADGYFAPGVSEKKEELLPQLKKIFPEVPFWVVHLDPVPEPLMESARSLGKITWIDLQKVRQSWSGDLQLHQKLADYLDGRLSGN